MAFPTLNVTPGTGQTINTLPNAGQQGSANSLPVVIANDQSAIAVSASSLPLPAGAAQESGGNLAVVATASGAPTDAAYAGTGNPSIIALLKGLYTSLTGTLTTRISGPVAVTGTFWQTTQPISAANLPLPTGAATAANQPTAAAQGSMTSGQTGPLTQGAVSTSSPTYTTGQTNPLSLTTAGALRVDGSAVTQPVNGTVTANPGTGTFAVSAATLPLPTGAAQESGGNLAALATAAGTPADTAWAGSGNSSIVAALKAIYAKVTGTLTTTISGPVAVTGTFWQTTQPVSAVTLPLPAGASTAANQTNVQSAPGTSASTALTVQGSASGVTIPVNGTVTANAGTGTFTVSAASLPLPTGAATSSNQPTNAAQGSTTSGQTGLLVQGAVTTGAPVYTTAQTNPLSLDTSGNLRVAQPDVCATSQSLAAGTLNTAVSIPLANAQATIGCVVSGLTASGATLTTELSKDGGTTWAAAANTSPGSGNTATTLTADGSFRMHCAGSTNARLRVSTIGTGSITVAYTVTAAPGIISIGDPLPQGANTIGNVQLWAAAASRWLHAAVPGGDIVNSTTAITLNAAGISGIKNYLTGLQIFAGGTIATGSEVYVRDGASGSYLWRGYIGAGAQGDIEVKFDNPLAGSAATAMLFGCVTAMGASSALYVNAQGFQAS